MRWLVIALRRIGDDRAATAGFAVLVLVTALLAAMAPRVLATLADDAVRAEVGAAPAGGAEPRVHPAAPPRRPRPAGDPLAVAQRGGDELFATVPSAVRALVDTRDIVIDSGRFRVQTPTTDPAFIRFRIHEGVGDHLTYVEGAAPSATVATRDDVGPSEPTACRCTRSASRGRRRSGSG